MLSNKLCKVSIHSQLISKVSEAVARLSAASTPSQQYQVPDPQEGPRGLLWSIPGGAGETLCLGMLPSKEK